MQIPMEILSNIMPRTDSGADARSRTFGASRNDPLFSKVLEKSSEAKTLKKIKEMMGMKDYEDTPIDDVRPVQPEKKDSRTPETESLIAGVMGYRNPVVIILEGDMESDTDPSICIDADIMAGTGIEGYAAPEESLDKSVDAQAQAEKAAPEANADDAAEQSPGVTAQDVKSAVDADNKAETVDTQTVGEAGEVTARTPKIRTSEQREDKENSSEFSEKGDLSPLENENDKVSTKGQKDKTESESGGADKNNAGDTSEPVNTNTMPFSESIRPERFMATEQMKRAADTPVKADNLFDEMVARIEAMNTGDKQTVTIQLKPEFLGNVALEIGMDAAGLHVKISAEDSGIRSMINGQITALIESLQNKGIEVVAVEVAYTGVDSGANNGSNNNQAQPERQRRPNRADGVDDGAAYLAALQELGSMDYYLDTGVSSVEYRA